MTALVFDVNETLLDLSGLDPHFEAAFGDASLRQPWFSLVLQSAFVGTITGRYVDFPAAQQRSLSMLAQRVGRDPDPTAAAALLAGVRELPAHPDVRPGLERLRAAGLTCAALTNSPLATAREQLAFAGLSDLLEPVLSADDVQRLKPAPEPYRMAADRLGVPVGEVLLVAAHSWDCAGALAAGARAAFLARPGQPLDPGGAQPELVVADLGELADPMGG